MNQIPHHKVPLHGPTTFDFEKVPLSEGLSIFVGRDTTTEDQLREQLVHMEKMGAIGRLVFGVAHELNNPLAGIVGYAELLSRAELDASTQHMVAVLKSQAERAGRIVQNFLNLATKTEPEKRVFDLNKVIESVLQLREYDYRVRDIVVLPDLDPDLPEVVGDAGQVEQVVLNLLINAEDAVMAMQDQTAEIQIRTLVLNNRIRLEVTDNGSGISSQDMNRIFYPFFTTKRESPSHGGTRLGLNICAESVKDHGGELFAWSTHGTVSTCTMELPIPEHPEDLEIPTPKAFPENAIRGKSIMVVDDEVTITDLMGDFLGRFGADVEFYNSGAAAFDRLCVKSFDAIVCDQRMPGVNGQGLHRMVQALDPDLAHRFCFCYRRRSERPDPSVFRRDRSALPEEAVPVARSPRSHRKSFVAWPAFLTSGRVALGDDNV